MKAAGKAYELIDMEKQHGYRDDNDWRNSNAALTKEAQPLSGAYAASTEAIGGDQNCESVKCLSAQEAAELRFAGAIRPIGGLH